MLTSNFGGIDGKLRIVPPAGVANRISLHVWKHVVRWQEMMQNLDIPCRGLPLIPQKEDKGIDGQGWCRAVRRQRYGLHLAHVGDEISRFGRQSVDQPATEDGEDELEDRLPETIENRAPVHRDCAVYITTSFPGKDW